MIYYILFIHYINDFLGQNLLFPDLEIGKNKSKSWTILYIHIILYTLGILLMMLPFCDGHALIPFVLINGGSHFVIDAITSRITSWAYREERFALFWNTIGFDQLLHVAILILTWKHLIE